VDPRVARSGKRRACSRTQQRVFSDQRAVEVAGNGLDLERKILWEVQPCGFARKSTRAFKSSGGRALYDFGMTPFG